ncbi:MAG TPA: YbaK/EbsC family protein [Alphaproteobacteria bacterium]|nr:YbaK/EbsC family protein [Alphaproteobacteria bacterium]
MSGTMTSPLGASARKVQAALRALGFANQVVERAQSTRTSAEAAAAVGCTVAQIAKSIVFRAASSDRLVLVIASGVNRVDERKVAATIGEGLRKADAEWVREKTGFVIGGVPPVGHETKPHVLVDRDLLTLPEIWAAAGTPNAVFKLTPDELVRMTGGTVADVAAPRAEAN